MDPPQDRRKVEEASDGRRFPDETEGVLLDDLDQGTRDGHHGFLPSLFALPDAIHKTLVAPKLISDHQTDLYLFHG